MAAGKRYEAKIDRRNPEKQLGPFMEKHHIDSLSLRTIYANHLQGTDKNSPDYYLAYKKGLGHLNETGNRLMAEALLDHLISREIITERISTRRGSNSNKLAGTTP